MESDVKRGSKFRWFAALCAVLWWGAPQPASAQDSGLDTGEVMFLTSCTSALPILGLSTTAGVYIKRREEWLREEIRDLKRVAVLDSYIDENEVGVRMALAMGAGEELEEMALIAGIEQLDEDARRALRAQQRAILDTPRGEFRRGWAMYTALRASVSGTNLAEVQ